MNALGGVANIAGALAGGEQARFQAQQMQARNALTAAIQG